jgi:hypothetical protein
MPDSFIYNVTWSEEDQKFVGTCDGFPFLSHLSSSPEAALRGIRASVADVVAKMRQKDRTRSRRGFMCMADFAHELGVRMDPPQGVPVFPSEHDCLALRPCSRSCGILEVEVRVRRVVSFGD